MDARNSTRWIVPLCCSAGIALLAVFHIHRQLALRWPAGAADERVRGIATIETIPVARGDGWSFDASLRIEAPEPQSSELLVRVMSRDAHVQPHAGERWRLLLSLRPPRMHVNPGAVDGERLLFRDGIHALGTVVASRLNQKLDAGHRPLTALRERIARHILHQVADRDAAALIAALAVGATGEMSREQWRVFNATGTTHLVAISGMHVTLFAVVMFALARRLWSLCLWRHVLCTRESFAAVTGLTAATAYAFLAGLSVPTQRTLIMLAAWWLARITARASRPLRPMVIALAAILLLDPLAPLSAGFWLSFAAMGAILLVTQTRLQRRKPLHEAVAVQLTVSIFLLPFTLACFGSVAVWSPVVNAAAIPYVSWILVPVILVSIVLMPFWTAGTDQMLRLAESLHNFAWPWLARAADSPLALIFASPPAWWYALAIPGIAILLLPWPWRLRTALLLALLPIAVADPDLPPSTLAEFTVLDTGNSPAIVVRTAHHVLVYGTGETYGTDGRQIESIVLPFLRSRGIHAVDMLIVSPFNAISAPGVTALLAGLPVKQTLTYGGAPPDFAGAGLCATGLAWHWDGVDFKVLDACALAISASVGQTRIERTHGIALRAFGRSGTAWIIVPGRNEKPGAAPSSYGEERLATGELGAIRFSIDREQGVTPPQGLRCLRRVVWRERPAACPGGV